MLGGKRLSSADSGVARVKNGCDLPRLVDAMRRPDPTCQLPFGLVVVARARHGFMHGAADVAVKAACCRFDVRWPAGKPRELLSKSRDLLRGKVAGDPLPDALK